LGNPSNDAFPSTFTPQVAPPIVAVAVRVHIGNTLTPTHIGSAARRRSRGVKYLAIAFAAGICAGWFLRRLRSKGDGGDLPPLLFVVISIVAELLSTACGGNGAQLARPLAEPTRRMWVLEQQMSECRRHAFNGQVGSDTRALKAFISFARTRCDLGAGTAAYAALHWMRRIRSKR
jgi:hypothetical protein